MLLKAIMKIRDKGKRGYYITSMLMKKLLKMSNYRKRDGT